MLKNLLILFALVLSFGTVCFAQTEKGFSFQGYARDYEGAALGSQSISVRFSIYPKGGAVEYEETQTVTTDPYGVFGATIGTVRPADFKNIFFDRKHYWLKVEVKALGSDFVEISNTQLLSVPYAKAADFATHSGTSHSAWNGVLVGSVTAFAGRKDKIPADYVVCDGRLLSKTDFAHLYSILGNTWGEEGNFFRVPDMRGMFLRGVNEGINIDENANQRFGRYAGGNGGDNVGTYQWEDYKTHNHTVKKPWNTLEWSAGNVGGGIGSFAVPGGGGDHHYGNTENSKYWTENRGGAETRPDNAAMYYIIKVY